MSTPRFTHLMVCIAPDGSFTVYPDGDAEQRVEKLRTLVRVLTEQAEAAICMAAGCGHDHTPQ